MSLLTFSQRTRALRTVMAAGWGAVVLLLVGCTAYAPGSPEAFEARWQRSSSDSAVSWWYVGETERSYVLVEKRALARTRYELPKTRVALIDIPAMPVCSSCEGVNLKRQHVRFHH